MLTWIGDILVVAVMVAFDSAIGAIKDVLTWCNDNEGALALLIFIVTLGFGWLSGIFAALRRRPKLVIQLVEGPNFCSSFETGRAHEGHPTHHTAISLYFSLKNLGSADTTVAAVHVGYRPRMSGIKWWFKRVWIVNQSSALGDFRVNIGENVKVYPFLFQRNFLMPDSGDNTFICVGGCGNGVCYWEQPESWGGRFPRVDRQNQVRLKVRAVDIYEKRYVKRFKIPFVPLEQARRYFPEFGMTHEALRRGQENEQQPRADQ